MGISFHCRPGHYHLSLAIPAGFLACTLGPLTECSLWLPTTCTHMPQVLTLDHLAQRVQNFPCSLFLNIAPCPPEYKLILPQ